MPQLVVATYDADAPELARLRDDLEGVAAASGLELRWQAGASDDAAAFQVSVATAGSDDVLVIVTHGASRSRPTGTVWTGRQPKAEVAVDALLPARQLAAGKVFLHVCYQDLPGNIENWLRKARPGSTVFATEHGSGRAFPRLLAAILSGDIPAEAFDLATTQLPRQWWRWSAHRS